MLPDKIVIFSRDRAKRVFIIVFLKWFNTGKTPHHKEGGGGKKTTEQSGWGRQNKREKNKGKEKHQGESTTKEQELRLQLTLHLSFWDSKWAGKQKTERDP